MARVKIVAYIPIDEDNDLHFDTSDEMGLTETGYANVVTALDNIDAQVDSIKQVEE